MCIHTYVYIYIASSGVILCRLPRAASTRTTILVASPLVVLAKGEVMLDSFRDEPSLRVTQYWEHQLLHRPKDHPGVPFSKASDTRVQVQPGPYFWRPQNSTPRQRVGPWPLALQAKENMFQFPVTDLSHVQNLKKRVLV